MRPSTNSPRGQTNAKSVKTASVPLVAPAQSGSRTRTSTPLPAKTTTATQPATARYGINLNTVTPLVVRIIRRRLKAKPRLPKGWDEKKIVSHLCLKVAGLLIQQKGEQALSIPVVVRDQADLLFAAFPDMRAQDDRWAHQRLKTLARVRKGK